MSTTTSTDSEQSRPSKRRRFVLLAGLFAVVALATVGITALLVTIFEHRQESRVPFVRLVEVNEVSTDPAPWGTNWPSEFDSYRRTVDDSETTYGGSSAMPASKLEEHPWLRRLYAGYAFSIDYREARGHAYMLYDQEVTERVTKRPQSGACLHCHASIIPTYRRLGMEAKGEKVDAQSLAADFNWPAVMDGFNIAGKMDYRTAHAELLKTPDGTSAEAINRRSPGRRRSSGGLHRLSRSQDDAGSGDPSGLHERNCSTGGKQRSGAAYSEHRTLARGRSKTKVRSERRCDQAGDA